MALPNADFTLNCSGQEASWRLQLTATPESRYATAHGSQQVLTLAAGEVLVSQRLSVDVSAGCGCAVGLYAVEVMGLRLRFSLQEATVTKATGDQVALDALDNGQRLQVLVTSHSDVPAELWSQLTMYLGPFPQATLAAPRKDLEQLGSVGFKGVLSRLRPEKLGFEVVLAGFYAFLIRLWRGSRP